MRIFGLIFVLHHEGMPAVFVRQHRLVPRLTRVRTDRFAIVLNDETDGQLMIGRILEAFVKRAGLGGHLARETMHARRAV